MYHISIKKKKKKNLKKNLLWTARNVETIKLSLTRSHYKIRLNVKNLQSA